MAYKLVFFGTLFTVAKAGIPMEYAATPTSYSFSNLHSVHLGHTTPTVTKLAAPLAYSIPAVPSSFTFGEPFFHYASVDPATAAVPATVKIAGYAAPVTKNVISEPLSTNQHDFGYSVTETHTEDSKSQVESRRGGITQGSYSLINSDGTKKMVDYTADELKGLDAMMRKETVGVKAVAPMAPAATAASAAKVTSPVGLAAPLTKISSPVTYSAPANFASLLEYAAPATFTIPGFAKVSTPVAYSAEDFVKYAKPVLYY